LPEFHRICLLLVLSGLIAPWTCPYVQAQSEGRPQSDRLLPAYPAEVAACQRAQPTAADDDFSVDPFAIPGVAPEDGQQFFVRVVPNTPLNRLLINLPLLSYVGASVPAALRCAQQLQPMNNGSFYLPHLAPGSYLVLVRVSVTKYSPGGTKLGTVMGMTAEGVPVTVQTQTPTPGGNYTISHDYAAAFTAIHGKPAIADHGWMRYDR
jgi:hypothetical protein